MVRETGDTQENPPTSGAAHASLTIKGVRQVRAVCTRPVAIGRKPRNSDDNEIGGYLQFAIAALNLSSAFKIQLHHSIAKGSKNMLRLERASQNQPSDTHKTPYDRVKRCRERKIYIKASERVNIYTRPGELRRQGNMKLIPCHLVRSEAVYTMLQEPMNRKLRFENIYITMEASECTFCGKTFTVRKNMLRRERSCSLNQRQVLQLMCDKSGKTISRRDKLQNNLRRCLGTIRKAATNSCNICYKTFEHLTRAQRHEAGREFNTEHSLLKCNNCSVQFTCRDNLVMHMKVCKGKSAQSVQKKRFVCLIDSAQPFCSRTSAQLKTIAGAGALTEDVENRGAVKFNIVLECTYGKQEPLEGQPDARAFKTKNVPVHNTDDIYHAVSQSIVKLCTEEREYTEKGSGWELISANCLQLRINKLDPLSPSSWIDLPASIKAKKANFLRITVSSGGCSFLNFRHISVSTSNIRFPANRLHCDRSNIRLLFFDLSNTRPTIRAKNLVTCCNSPAALRARSSSMTEGGGGGVSYLYPPLHQRSALAALLLPLLPPGKPKNVRQRRDGLTSQPILLSPLKKPTGGARIFWELGHSAQLGD
ncbi:hypothetical protein PR048_033137 [Dryococelus australis]|uniref:C2H2-type domain-containing protein n=1 Tax=Dryococelus australis TaxID=614101 RepID=A0ABQ9G2J2_9NEOP|nr:hypothetical protein PR048_033137 [Dryococelus australis]